ncbi:MAG: LysM domain-containing protein [Pirellulaceae bacterium]
MISRRLSCYALVLVFWTGGQVYLQRLVAQDFAVQDFLVADEAVIIEDAVILETQDQVFAQAFAVFDQPESQLIAADATWKYWDAKETPGEKWHSQDFDDQDWKSGPAPLGYGDGRIATNIEFGGDANEKNLVAFFRYKFKRPEAADEMAKIAGKLSADDGAVVYLNGTEVYRYNLPEGNIEPNTTAVTAYGDDQEFNPWLFIADTELLNAGDNILAVEVHQGNATSSDLGFALQLVSLNKEEAETIQVAFDAQQAGQASLFAEMEQAQEVEQLGIALEAADFQAEQVDRQQYHFTDGSYTYYDQNGVEHQYTSDALNDASSTMPGAKFRRAFAGDTLAKVAFQEQMDVEKLRILNRTKVDKVFSNREIFCVAWKHKVQPNDTLESLAKFYRTSVRNLQELNDLSDDQALEPGTELDVPGEFQYMPQDNGQSYLMVTVYQINGQNNFQQEIPFKEETMRHEIQRLKTDDTLATFAERHEVTEEYLRLMNGLEEDEEVKPGRTLLVDYSVELKEDATIDTLIQLMRGGVAGDVDEFVDRFLKVNELESKDDIEPGQRLSLPVGDQMGFDSETEAVPVSDEPIEIIFQDSGNSSE